MFEQDQTVLHTQNPAQPSRKKRNISIIIVVAFLAIICFCLAAAAALLYFDPFNWGLLGRLFGGYDAVAKTAPADTDVYLSVDMLKLLSADTRDVINAFAQSSGDPAITTREDILQQADDTLMADYGVTFTGDIQPWIGQYLGFDMYNISFDEYDQPVIENWFVVIEARNKKAADAFIQKLTAHITEQTGQTFQQIDHEGAVIRELNSDVDTYNLAIGRSKSMLYLARDAASIIHAIDAQSGDNLSTNEYFKSVTAQLPGTRLMTAFVSQALFQKAADLLERGGYSYITSTGNVQNFGLALSLINDSIQFDLVSAYDVATLPQAQIDILSAPGASGKIAEDLPQDTMAFITGNDLRKVWDYAHDLIQQSSGSTPEEFNESMQLLKDQIGINPDTDLFPLLDREWGLAVLRERDTVLAEQLNAPLGLLGVFETSNAVQLGENIHSMADNLSTLGLVMVNEKTSASMTYYEMSTFLVDQPILAFGTREAQLLLSTNAAHLETKLEPAQTLANAAAYQTTWKRFSSQMQPILYMDMAQLYSVVPELGGADLSAIQPIQTLALAGSPLQGNTKQWVLILVVDTASTSK